MRELIYGVGVVIGVMMFCFIIWYSLVLSCFCIVIGMWWGGCWIGFIVGLILI